MTTILEAPDPADIVHDRRRLLVAAVGVAVGCAVAACAGGAAAVAVPRVGDTVRLPFDRFPQLARPGGRAIIEADDTTIEVVRGADGGARALSLRCTHQGCQVSWQAEAAQFGCPCHGSRFSETGDVVQGPAKQPLRTFPTSIEGNDVVVKLAGGSPA